MKTEVRDPAGIHAERNRLRLVETVFGATKLFSGSKTGWAVQLPEWRYPVVCDVATGSVDFDIAFVQIAGHTQHTDEYTFF